MPRPLIDITGQRFGRLVAQSRVATPGRTRWLCICDCGREHQVAWDSLREGLVRSCGCLRREVSKEQYKRMAAVAAERRARVRSMYETRGGNGGGYCDKPSRPLKVRRDAVLALASALGLAR